jgi:hypothetical protein
MGIEMVIETANMRIMRVIRLESRKVDSNNLNEK